MSEERVVDGGWRFRDRLGSLDERYEGDSLVLERRGRGLGTELLRFNHVTKLLQIFPKSWRGVDYGHQFTQVAELQIEDFELDLNNYSGYSERFGLATFEGLPKGFGAVYEYGLGIKPEYRGLVRAIEERSTCSIVRFVGPGGEEGVQGGVFRLALSRFEAYRQVVDRNRRRAATAVGRVIDAEARNSVAGFFGLDRVEPKYGRNPTINALTEEIATGFVMTEDDRAALVDQVRTEAPRTARESPERFGRLRQDIELVSLELLIEQFEKGMIGQNARDEAYWQDFFQANPFALQQVFGAPIVEVLPQAHLRSGGVTGKGARITDFLCKNTVTRTAVVVEIKTPSAALMEPKPYRSIYAPHRENLAGAVGQLQAQVASVSRDLAGRPDRDPEIGDLDLWHTSGAVVVGRVGDLTGEQRESFLRYREGLASTAVLGFDEVSERLRGLLQLLRNPPAEASA